MNPKFFFCSNCGKFHEIWKNDLHTEQWGKMMLYIAENNPDSLELAEIFGVHRRSAQYRLKEFKELAALVVKSVNSKEKRISK
ncbi:unnamed protein product [marine sediment metagenome]|uniref:Transposase Helix-turn-helix domain-containing protein n=1 Tax=marine sediment metagenome TaxID=412755 RepID=X0ZU48_9ZZZZ